MYARLKIRSGCACGVISRYLSSAEISTALRPFYFTVHPDLFGKYPEQQKVNENSLQQLSALLEAQQTSRKVSLPPLSFYLRQKDMPEGHFKLVKIKVTGSCARDTVVNVLSACDISTKYIDKIPKSSTTSTFSNDNFTRTYEKYNSEFQDVNHVKSKIREKKVLDYNVVDWIIENSSIAKEKYEMTFATREQVDSLSKSLRNLYDIKEVKWDSGWNISHIRGALQSLMSLAGHHSQYMDNLKGRTLAFGQFTGVSLDGDVFLSVIDVRSEWLDLIKNVHKQDGALRSIPNYEKTLSNILRDIHICRRKFMPKVTASRYCNHLRQITTSIGDYYGKGKTFSPTVPDSLSKYEIVVEPEAGPLMVSPTGQFITPSSCPADELIDFIANHLDQAMLLLTEYSINKHIEKALHKEVKERFGLLELHKDDSVTPSLMILCCQRLLTRVDQLSSKLQGSILNITHYYSVLSEGVLCIPWNFK